MIHAIRPLLEIIGALTLTATALLGILWAIAVHTFDITEGFDIYDGRDDR